MKRIHSRTLRTLPILLMMAVFVIACSQGEQPASSAKVNDGSIAEAVTRELSYEEAVPASHIDVRTTRGIVTLTGSTTTMFARERAVNVAGSIKGVRSVVDNISVETPARADSVISNDINKKIAIDPVIDIQDVGSTVRNGAVTLTGSVDSWQQREIAENIVLQVKGVTSIDNKVEVDTQAERPDDEIRHEVERRLALDPFIDDGLIKVKVVDGSVSLIGSVGCATEKARAYADSWVRGVDGVDDGNLTVVEFLDNEMKRDEPKPRGTDDDIEQAVRDAFLFDPRVRQFALDVDVTDGEATIMGTVDNLLAKRAAIRDAENTLGVYSVDSDLLRVRPVEEMADKEITAMIRDQLSEDPLVEQQGITVMTRNRKVYLNGMVDTMFEKKHIEQVSAGIPGVVTIANNIEVSGEWEWKSDSEIQKAIEDELFWSPYVDEGDITVTVNEGEAELRGTVSDRSEKTAAVVNAFEGGAKTVSAELTIEPDGYSYNELYQTSPFGYPIY